MSTSDSVDRVFVHALATVRRLPRTGSSRPPPSARLRLYGLYKQSMEGDVAAILPRPTLPPPSPNPNDFSTTTTDPNQQQQQQQRPSTLQHRDSTTSQHTAVHRYASRDLRTREAQAEIEKWDAWHACAGMSRTEAKRRYIEALIGTMKEYASGTAESRELVGELEFVWGQIRSQSQSGSGSNGEGKGGGHGSGSGSGGEEGESPRRSGLKGLLGSELSSGSGSGGRKRREERTSDGGRLRVLSPMSPREGSDIVEGEEDGVLDDEAVEASSARSKGTMASRFAAMEAQLRALSTEIAALREQLSANKMLESSGYSPYTYRQLSLRWKVWYKLVSWVKWFLWLGVRQVCLGMVVLSMLVAWGRWKGDRRAEEWARRRWKDIRLVLGQWCDKGWWLAGLLRVRSMLGGH